MSKKTYSQYFNKKFSKWSKEQGFKTDRQTEKRLKLFLSDTNNQAALNKNVRRYFKDGKPIDIAELKPEAQKLLKKEISFADIIQRQQQQEFKEIEDRRPEEAFKVTDQAFSFNEAIAYKTFSDLVQDSDYKTEGRNQSRIIGITDIGGEGTEPTEEQINKGQFITTTDPTKTIRDYLIRNKKNGKLPVWEMYQVYRKDGKFDIVIKIISYY